jgi:2-haloacid dehalogenase
MKKLENTRPVVLFFDVNETLLDLKGMQESIAKTLGGRSDLLPLWFTTMLQYSLVATVSDRYEGFGDIGVAALLMVAGNNGIDLTKEEAQTAVKPMLSLPPHAEVPAALKKLRQAGFRTATLTNSTNVGVASQMKNAGLTDLFDARLSVEEVGMYKPHSHVYRWAARRMGARTDDCMLIAAHGWDVAGAIWAGMRAAFVSRPGQQLYPLAPVPEIVAPDLDEVAARLLAMSH